MHCPVCVSRIKSGWMRFYVWMVGPLIHSQMCTQSFICTRPCARGGHLLTRLSMVLSYALAMQSSRLNTFNLNIMSVSKEEHGYFANV